MHNTVQVSGGSGSSSGYIFSVLSKLGWVQILVTEPDPNSTDILFLMPKPDSSPHWVCVGVNRPAVTMVTRLDRLITDMYNVDDAENTWFYMQYMIKNINKSIVLFFNCYRKVKSSHSFFLFVYSAHTFWPQKRKMFCISSQIFVF